MTTSLNLIRDNVASIMYYLSTNGSGVQTGGAILNTTNIIDIQTDNFVGNDGYLTTYIAYEENFGVDFETPGVYHRMLVGNFVKIFTPVSVPPPFDVEELDVVVGSDGDISSYSEPELLDFRVVNYTDDFKFVVFTYTQNIITTVT